MKNNPKEDSNKKQRKASLPKGHTPPVMDGSNQPIDKQKSSANSGGGANKPPTENNNLTEPEGSDSKKEEWRKDYRLKIITLVVSTLALAGTIWALYNTTKTLNANREQFEVSNRPFIDLSVKMDSIKEGQRPIIYYNITNKGRFPALVTQFKSVMGIALPQMSVDTIIAKSGIALVNKNDTFAGIIPFSPTVSTDSIRADSPLTKGQFNAVMQAKYIYIIFVEIRYKNLVTGARYHYLQVIKLVNPPHLVQSSARYIDDPE
jgi:hypothetical protein